MAQTKMLHKKRFTHFTLSHVKEDTNKYRWKKEKSKKRKRTDLLKRIPLEKLMDLKIDYAFKQLFGNEKNKEITIEFLNAILQKSGRNKIKEVTFLNTEIGREYEDDKESRLDLLVLTDANESINVEIQFSNKYDMIERSLFYWAGIYHSMLTKGKEYKQLRPVIVINILNYDMMNEIDLFHTMFHLRESIKYIKLTNLMEFHFIEMPKLLRDWKADKLDPWNNVLARWLLLLGMVDARNKKVYEEIYRELEEIAMNDETLRDAFAQWEDLSMTEEQRLAYLYRLKQVLDEEAYRARIRRMEEKLEKNKQVFEQDKRLFERDKQVYEQDKQVFVKDKQVFEKDKQVFEQDKQVFEQDKQVFEQDKQVFEKERQLVKQKEKEIERTALELNLRMEKTAIHLLNQGIDIDLIKELTDLSKEKIIELQRDM